MRMMAKLGLGTAVIMGAAIGVAAPAAAQISFGFGFSAPVVRAAPAPFTCYDGYGNPYYSYDPYACEYAPYTAPAYAPPVVEPYYYYGGTWGGYRDYGRYRDREFRRDRDFYRDRRDRDFDR